MSGQQEQANVYRKEGYRLENRMHFKWGTNRETLYEEANNSTGRNKVRHPGQAQYNGKHLD